MANNPFNLLTPKEAEEKFGKKYFYRQRIYRLASNGKIMGFEFRGQTCHLAKHILQAFLKDLELRIQNRFPELDASSLQVFYDTTKSKRIVVDGLFGKGVSVNTDEETEEDLLNKIGHVVEWLGSNSEEIEKNNDEHERAAMVVSDKSKDEYGLAEVLPEEITWVRLDTGLIEGVEVKSYILISLPSVARFMGIRPDQFIEWVSQRTFGEFILSAHYKHLQGTEISVPWKKGIVRGYVPLVPFELLPEMIVAFKQSGRGIQYPEKAQLLYEIAKKTLEAVGLAISGGRDKAAQELVRVGKGLGLTEAEQIIAIFKQYETREYQVQTTKEFQSKIKRLKLDYKVTIGSLTFGITGRYVSQWKILGDRHNLPKKITDSSREVMRKLSPEDSVGMTFGESHFIKDPKLMEAIETGKKGKEFYSRLKKVGLLES